MVEMMRNSKYTSRYMVFIVFSFCLSGCTVLSDLQSQSSLATIEKGAMVESSNYEHSESHILGVVRDLNMQSEYAAYLTLILSDKTTSKNQIRAAADIIMCNFDDTAVSSIPSLQAVALTAPIVSGSKSISNGKELLNAYWLEAARNILQLTYNTDLTDLLGQAPNSLNGVYLLASGYKLRQLTNLFKKELKSISQNQEFSPFFIATAKNTFFISLSNFTPNELAVLFTNIRTNLVGENGIPKYTSTTFLEKEVSQISAPLVANIVKVISSQLKALYPFETKVPSVCV